MNYDDLIGRAFGANGQYLIEKKLGEGGMGVVVKALDVPGQRHVAIKFLRSEGMVDAESMARFKNEGNRFGRFRHTNIVSVYELGTEEGELYIVTEFVDGRSLHSHIQKDGRFDPVRACNVMESVCSALSLAHAQGVVHRDLKPENIMIRNDDGVVKLLDFGIAKDLNAATNITRAGTFVGTPAYSAPEQIRGGKIDGRTDIFALGVILYEMLSGEQAFAGQRTIEVLKATIQREPIAVEKLNRDVPPALADLLRWMIAKDMKDRPASCDVVRAELERIRKLLESGTQGHAIPRRGGGGGWFAKIRALFSK
jgi:serine/threonine-protein kinase